jgi:RsiW-degrading membrane proteinase PrsW (M82 family)
MTILLAASLIPPLFLLWKVYQSDKIEKEPPKLLLIIFVLGMISAIPAGILEVIGGTVLTMLFPAGFAETAAGSMLFNFIYFLIVVGGSEELVKFLAMRIPTWRNRNFNYVFDGVVYGVTSALGFAALENVMYVLDTGLTTAGIRAWTAIPLHCIAGIFMGHYYGIAKAAERWSDSRERNPALRGRAKNRFLRRSILVPMVIHGLYDFIATGENMLFLALFFVYIIIVDIFAYNSLKQYSRNDISLETGTPGPQNWEES